MEKRTTTKNRNGFSKYLVSILLFLLFEAVAITLWLTKNNLFYLLNFSYIGCCLSLGTALFTAGKRYARHFVQLAVGCYMLLYLGVFSRENMQIEGSGIICFSVLLKRRLSIMQWRRSLSVTVRTGLVRLRLLDSHGAGFSAIQAAAEATKGKAGDSALCNVFIVAGIGFSSVSDAGHTFGENHVLDVPCESMKLFL